MTETSFPVASCPARAATRPERWLERALLVAMLLGTAVALSRNTADADLWGHILFGQETIAAGGPPSTATHTYTAVGYPWINHENLSEVTLATLQHYGGGPGLLAAKCLLSLVLMGSMIFVARRKKVSVVALCLVMLVVVFNLSPGFTLRPQLSTYLGLGCLVLILDAAFARWESEGRIRYGLLCLLIPLMILWTNSHGGFLAGASLLALYLGVRIVESFCRFGRAGWPAAARLSALGFGTALATFVTPYGPLLHEFLYDDLKVPRPEIAEWVPLTLASAALAPALLMFALCGISLLMTRRRRDPAQVALLLAAAVQSVAHGRHLPLMAVLFGYWIPPYLESVCDRFRKPAANGGRNGLSPRSAWAMLGVVSLGCLFMGSVLVERCRQLWVNRTEFPVAAVQYMADRGMSGRLVATFNWAEYLMAALPQTVTNFDGRCRTCYPQSVHDMHFDFVLGSDPQLRWRSPNSPPVAGDMVLEFGRPDLVLLDRRQPPSVAALDGKRDWVLLYQDEIAQVWGRSSRFGDPKSPDFIAPADRQIGDAPQDGYAAWPALPVSGNRDRRTTGHLPPLKLPSRGGAI